MKVLTLPVLLFFLLFASPALSQVTDDNLIVPGERIGKWKLAMSLGEFAAEANGQVAVVRTNIVGTLPDMKVYYWRSLLIGMGTRDNKVLELVSLGPENEERESRTEDSLSPWVRLQTATGIALGSSREKVEKAFEKPTLETSLSLPPGLFGPQKPGVRLIYDAIGIGFLMVEHCVFPIMVCSYGAENIYVFRSGNAKNIWKF